MAEQGGGEAPRKKKKKGQNVKIYARIRQLMPWEPNRVSLFIKGKKVQNHTNTTHNEYTFQNTFDTDITNEDIFKTMVRPMIENVLDGFNAILIAYGQTGSGKTYSMLGKPDLNIIGLLPHMLGYVHGQASVKSVELSAVEAFGHHVARVELFDLFNPANQTRNWTEKTGRTQLDPRKATKVPIEGTEDARQKIIYAHAGSHFAPTGKNPESSRGHVCFVAKITQQHPEIEHHDLISYFVMVDCAGSEGESAFTRDFIQSVPANVLMSRRLEAGTINTGLSQLQIIFNELRFKGSLSPMIGGGMRRILHSYINTKTFLSVLFTLSPSVNNAKSTESTLKFAVAAGMVKVKPVKADAQVNLNSLVEQLRAAIAENEKTIDGQQDEITQLQVDLEAAKQEAITAGRLQPQDTLPSATKKIRKSRLQREQLNLETLSALPPELLAQLQEFDDEESSDEELDDMFVVEADVVEADIQAEMQAALQVMHERTQSVAIIEENQDDDRQAAIEATLALADVSVSQITIQREEEGDEEAAGFVDFSEMKEPELLEHQEKTWGQIETVRTEQTKFREKLGAIVDQLTQSTPHSAWNFKVIEDIRDALPTD